MWCNIHDLLDALIYMGLLLIDYLLYHLRKRSTWDSLIRADERGVREYAGPGPGSVAGSGRGPELCKTRQMC